MLRIRAGRVLLSINILMETTRRKHFAFKVYHGRPLPLINFARAEINNHRDCRLVNCTVTLCLTVIFLSKTSTNTSLKKCTWKQVRLCSSLTLLRKLVTHNSSTGFAFKTIIYAEPRSSPVFNYILLQSMRKRDKFCSALTFLKEMYRVRVELWLQEDHIHSLQFVFSLYLV